MKAAIAENGKMVWKDVPEPVIGDTDVLVKVHATALNRADLLQKQGTYPSPAGWPGCRAGTVGTVEDMGKTARQKSGFRIGDNVCALVGGGGYAEKAAVPYPLLMPIPKNITMEEAASLPEVYATSYLNLFYEGKLAPGQTLYVAARSKRLGQCGDSFGKGGGRVCRHQRTDLCAGR